MSKGKSSSGAFLSGIASVLEQVEDTDHWKDDFKEILDVLESDPDAPQEGQTAKSLLKVIQKADFGKPGDVVTEGESLYLQLMSENDQNRFIQVCRQTSSTPRMFDMKEFCDSFFRDSLGDEREIHFLIFEKEGDRFCGECSIHHFSGNKPEIGIRFFPEYQHRGYGTQTMRVLMSLMRKMYDIRQFIVKTYNDNIGCRRLLEKLGAAEKGREESEYTRGMTQMKKAMDWFPEDIDTTDERYIVVYELKESGMAGEE